VRTLVAAVAVVVLLSGCQTSRRQVVSHAPAASAKARLPFPGRTILPGHRVIAFYGAAQTPSMGILGHASPERIAPRLLKQANAYDPYGEPVVPAFELIATVAQSDAGADGDYSAPTDAATIEQYLRAARAIHGLLILDIQPGRASFLREVRRYERFLRDPDVSLALDSEWSMGPQEVPAQVIGGTSGEVVNGVSAYLASLVRKYDLPQKLLIVHQFTPDMIEHRNAIVSRPGIALIFHVDGFGTRAGKLSKYRLLSQSRGAAFMGFKLFYSQDIDMFSAPEVMRFRPRPDLVTYE
jgi:hypothetical protein